MASFQAKISWERLRKRENKKKNRSNEFLPDPLQKIKKKQQKYSNTLLWLLSKPKYVGEGREREKKTQKKKKSFR